MSIPSVSVIISTYNQPVWLEKVLWSYDTQIFKDFEVIIADDGSSESTEALIQKMKTKVSFSIHHVWHEDDGFRKTTILNKATSISKGDYIVYTDGDCIARKDFLQTHINKRKKRWFLSGGYYKLPKDISDLITKEDIDKQYCFNVNWLEKKGMRRTFKSNKLTAKGIKEYLLNTLTPTKSTFDGMNVSAWKKDILSVNGFDERMQYGGEDREIGERLFNLGIKAKQIRYSAICLHLYHERSYVKPEMIAANKEIRSVTKKSKLKWTDYGIKK